MNILFVRKSLLIFIILNERTLSFAATWPANEGPNYCMKASSGMYYYCVITLILQIFSCLFRRKKTFFFQDDLCEYNAFISTMMVFSDVL